MGEEINYILKFYDNQGFRGLNSFQYNLKTKELSSDLNVKKDHFKLIYDNAETFCQDFVSKSYITNPYVGKIEGESEVDLDEMHKKRKDYSSILLYERIKKTRGRHSYIENHLKGFIFYIYKSNGVYLDVICAAKGQGSKLLNGFIEFSKLRDLHFVQLKALMNVLRYYSRFNFKYGQDCSRALDYDEKKAKELDQKVKELPSGNSEILLNEPKFRDFINFLQENNFNGTTKKGNCIKKLNTKRDINNFLNDECEIDGFYMILCLKDSEEEAQKKRRL